MTSHIYRVGLILMLAVTAGMYAGAQGDETSYFDRDRYTAVTERAQPEYDPLPIRLGAFEAQPTLTTGLGYRSNLFATDTNEASDGFLIFAPSVEAETTWSRHKVGAYLEANHREYFDNGDESRTDLISRLNGRLDASSQLNFTGSIFADKINESRYDAANIAGAAEPTEVDRFGGDVGLNYTAGRIKLNAGIGAETLSYNDVALQNGLIRDQSFRDVDKTELSGRASWAVDRDLAVFAEAQLIDRDYDTPTVPFALDRDSEGQIFRVGANFELPVLMRGDIAVGYQSYDFSDASLSSVDGVSVEGEVQWFVSQLTTLTGEASRMITDPGLLGSAAVVETRMAAKVDHELRRNWLAHGAVAISSNDFESINRTDDRVSIGLGTTWKVNRNVWLDASYQYVNQDSDFQSFSDNRVLFALKLHP